MSTGLIAGSKYHWLGSRDSNGYPMGALITPDSPTQDATYTPIVRTCGFVQKGAMGVEDSVAEWFEGNQICGKLNLGVSSISDFTTEFASKSFEYDDFCSGHTEASPASGWEVGGVNTGESILPQRFAGFGTYYLDDSGNQQYLTSLYHNVQVRVPDISSGQGDGQNPNNLTYNYTPTKTSRLITGDAVGTTYEAYRYVLYILDSAGWVFSETYIGDGSTTTFTLSYLPVSSDATGAADNRITLNGATQTVDSVNTSTGVVTFSSAPAADAIVVVSYPTLFVASS
jgi:hypothetical protein